MVYGLWPMAYGLWSMVYAMMVYGPWPMAYGLWPMIYGLSHMWQGLVRLATWDGHMGQPHGTAAQELLNIV